MDAVASLLEQDRDQCFADWGVTVVLRQTAQTYEPETGEIAEAHEDHEATALVQSVEMKPAEGTAGQHAVDACVFLVRREDVPESGLRTARVLHAEAEWRVEHLDQSASGGVIALQCVRL